MNNSGFKVSISSCIFDRTLPIQLCKKTPASHALVSFIRELLYYKNWFRLHMSSYTTKKKTVSFDKGANSIKTGFVYKGANTL